MFGALLLVSGILLGQSDASAPGAQLKSEVRKLVRQLNAPRLADREKAEEQLLKLGPEAIEYLPSNDDSIPAETKQRVARIRQTLQQKASRSAALGSTVTLKGQLPLSKILAALEEQTGNKITAAQGFDLEADNPTLKVDFDQKPFWQALDQVVDQAGLTVYNYGEEKAVTLRPRSEGMVSRLQRAFYQGPFRFEPAQIEAVRDLRNIAQKGLTLTLEVAWEPKLTPITLLVPMDRIETVDESGQQLPVNGIEAELEIPASADSMASELRIPFVLPPRSVERIEKLKGVMIALLPGKIETFRFQNLEKAKDVEQRIAGVTVVLEGVRKNNDAWEVRIRVRFDQAGEALQSHRTWIFDNEVYLETSDGNHVAWSSYETTRQTENELGIAYLFSIEAPLAGHTLVYKTPGTILTSEIPYEIHAIPLP